MVITERGLNESLAKERPLLKSDTATHHLAERCVSQGQNIIPCT